MTGILALWNDCAPEGMTQYEDWYVREHLLERVGVQGFRFGRRYEAVEGEPRFFSFYEVDDPGVLATPAYVERLDHPTPATIRAMASFRNMNRTVCEVVRSAGALMGAWVVTLRFDGNAPPASGLEPLWSSLAARPGVTALHWWVAAATAPRAETVELKLRGGADASITAALVVECVRRHDAERAAREIGDWMRSDPARAAQGRPGIYSFLCAYARSRT